MAAGQSVLCDDFLAGLRSALGKRPPPLALHEPQFAGNEWQYVKECIDTGWVSSAGKYVDEFEQRLADYTGAAHAVAVVNGTAALHLALKLAGVQANDEVLVPAFCFVATANAIAHCEATPHFVDSSSTTLGLDPRALAEHLARVSERVGGGLRNRESGRRIAAVVPMHTFGHPIDLGGLLETAGRYGLPIVEDAAESLGSTYEGKHTGAFGVLGALSFNGNKIVTTGGGGALLTNDAKLAQQAKQLSTTAKRSHPWEFSHDEVAWNYRLPNINAALGCAQLERLPEMVAAKRQLAKQYETAFAQVPGMSFMMEPPRCCSNYWLNTVLLDLPDQENRDALLSGAHRAGYLCRPAWTLLHTLPMYATCPRADLPVAQDLALRVINVPSSADLAAAG